jgi:hypothetical protein
MFLFQSSENKEPWFKPSRHSNKLYFNVKLPLLADLQFEKHHSCGRLSMQYCDELELKTPSSVEIMFNLQVDNTYNAPYFMIIHTMHHNSIHTMHHTSPMKYGV